MKKQKNTGKKLSLNKLQMVRVNLQSIKGGLGIGGNDTVLDNTYTKDTKTKQDGGVDN